MMKNINNQGSLKTRKAPFGSKKRKTKQDPFDDIKKTNTNLPDNIDKTK